MSEECPVSKMKRIGRAVGTHQLHYLSSKSCTRSTSRHFDRTATKIFACLASDLRTSEFEYGPCKTYGLSGIRNAVLDRSTRFHSTVIRIGT